MCKFSIIIPVYNVEKYIDECIQSVLNQKFYDYELILINDGSPDNSGCICDRYSQKDNRILVIHKENGGLSSARNAGLDVAKGDYILFLDSDDYWCDNNVLSILNKYIDDFKSDILIIGIKKFYQKTGKYVDIKISKCDKIFSSHIQSIKYLMEKNLFVACAWDKVVRRSIIEENGLRFVENQFSEDIEWSVKLLLFSSTIQVVENNFYVYRQQNSSSITSNIGRKNLEDIMMIIKKYTSLEYKETPLIHFIANQYVVWLTISNYVCDDQIIDLLQDAKSHWSLLMFDWYPYVKKVSYLKIFGFSFVRRLLGVYRKFKALGI